MSVEGSRDRPFRSCVSLNSSCCSSPTRLRASGSCSQPATTPTSPKDASAQRGSKFLQLFNMKKHANNTREPSFLFAESSSISARSRLSRTLWPFSRSNSAGESKSAQRVLPLPRRSKSAGESKSTSPSIVSTCGSHEHSIRQAVQRTGDDVAGSFSSIRKSACNIQTLGQQTGEKALPPRPNSSTKRGSSCFMLSNCNVDSITFSGPQPPLPSTPRSVPVSHSRRDVARSTEMQSSDVEDNLSVVVESNSCISTECNLVFESPGRKARSASVPKTSSQNGRQGSKTLGMYRCGPIPRGARAKDALNGDTGSVRVTPVLNMPACMTPSSKSKLFNVGNLFFKRERADRSYSMLVTADS
ncbi:hypothetical protein KP509_36G035100 [Ceratopteris richardii]|nr:hypothetical protein KP509_36G035100 [Ceratopteris richardii]